MSTGVSAVVAVARCQQQHQTFGIRFEQVEPRHWTGDWAFAVQGAEAKREHYDRTLIEGAIDFALSYPGCPFCEADGAFRCECGKLNCWDGRSVEVVCAWCRQAGQVGGVMDTLEVGRDS